MPLLNLVPKMAESDSLRGTVLEPRSRSKHARAQLYFYGKNICRACRENSKRYLRVNHSVHNFINGAISSSCQNQIGRLFNALPGQARRCARAGSGNGRYTMPASGKSVNSAVEKFILIANQLAGKRVIDEKCVSINCDKGASELSSL
jgi:hypothetical protein